MINSSRDKDFGVTNDDRKLGKISTTTTTTTPTTSRQWAGFKHPRIVRVSRSFRGKDRHSKVCTIRGLRDRRIRLSVPTAVQLYDLQDRLGLTQPSKVVDWLLDATKHDIDKLPPLQMPAGGGEFSQFLQPTLEYPHDLIAPQSNSLSPFFNINSEFIKDGGSHQQLFNKGIRINDRGGDDDPTVAGKAKYWTNSYADPRAKCKEVQRDDHNIAENNKWSITRSDHQQENQGGNCNGGYISQLSAQNFFPLANHFPFPSLLNSSNLSSYNWDPSNLSLSQFGGQLGFPSQAENSQSTTHHNSVSFPSSLALNPTTSQLFFRPPATPPSFFPPYMASSIESDPRQISHFQLLTSSSQHSPLRFVSPFKVNDPQNNNDSQPNKRN